MKNPIWIESAGLSQHWGKMLIWSRRHHPETSISPYLLLLLLQQTYSLGFPATCMVLVHLPVSYSIHPLSDVPIPFILTLALVQSCLAVV